MLHAVLHHKLNELVPEPQRLEDALTSLVFGTLVLVNAWDILARWLGVPGKESVPSTSPWNAECWFWPGLAFAEPDVVLRLGNFLVVVEAKYRSGRNDLVPSEDDDADLCDQFVRQHRSITEPVENRVRYPEPIEQAIAQCRLVQAFVIDARRWRRARREFQESKKRLNLEADLRIVTWQELFRILNDQRFQQNRWAMDLRSYLQTCGLDAFEGIGHYRGGLGDVTRIQRWREQNDYSGWQHAVAALVFAGNGLAVIEDWRSPMAIDHGRWIHGVDPKDIEIARRVIISWRPLSQVSH